MPSRRRFLQVSGVGFAGGLAGCSALPLPRPEMDFAVDNARSEAVMLDVAFLRPDVSERSEALVYRDSLEIPSREAQDEPCRKEDVAEDRPYRIELFVGQTHRSHHYHYRPDCSEDTPYEIGVLVTLTDEGVRFTQTQCSDDEPFL